MHRHNERERNQAKHMEGWWDCAQRDFKVRPASPGESLGPGDMAALTATEAFLLTGPNARSILGLHGIKSFRRNPKCLGGVFPKRTASL